MNYELNEEMSPKNLDSKTNTSENTESSESTSSTENSFFVKHRDTLKSWWQASRPPFYIATLVPLVLGLVAAIKEKNSVSIWLFILILLACFFVHLATNLANDLFDHWQKTDSEDTIGGSRVIQEGRLKATHIVLAMSVSYALALGLAFAIVHFSGQHLLWLLIAIAAFSSIFYVAPPIKYGYRGLGEISVFLNMGLIMPYGTYIALSGNYDFKVLALSFPIAFMVANILYFQSLPEIESDPKAGKHTLASIIGKEKAGFLFLLWWPLIWFLMINLYFVGLLSWLVFLGLLSMPLFIIAYRRIKSATDWVLLDKDGYLVRQLYLINGIILILALFFH